MQQIKLFANFETQQFTTLDGGTAAPLSFVAGDKLRFQCAFGRLVDGEFITDNTVGIRAIRCSIGPVFKAPTDGLFRLTYVGGDAQSEDIPWNATAEQFRVAIASWTFPTTEAAVIARGDGEWFISCDPEGAAPEVIFSRNTLSPRSFIRVRTLETEDVRNIEIKLLQSPWAFTETWDRVLADAPHIAEIAEGTGGDSLLEAAANAIQAIVIPKEFQGTFRISHNLRTSGIIGSYFSPSQIETELNKMYSDGTKRFRVTVPEDDKAYVEFVGPLGESAQPLMTVEVRSFQPGTPTFELDLNTRELDAALRLLPKLDNVSFELEVEFKINNDDPPETPGRIVTFQQLVSVVRQQIYPELNEARLIDYLQPPEPRDYRPRTLDQIITGIQVAEFIRGNGSARVFAITHDLNTRSLSSIIVVNNLSGLVLTHGQDYSVTINSDSIVTITLAAGYATPGTNGLYVSLQTAGPRSAFQDHTHTIAQILGLIDELNAIKARLGAIEDKMPTSTPVVALADSGNAQITVDEKAFQYPSVGLTEAQIAGIKAGPVVPVNYGYLLGAIHDAVETNTIALPALAAGQAYEAGAPFYVPGRGGHKSFTAAIGDKVACDGVQFYKVLHVPGTKSYFPDVFEKELFSFAVSSEMLRQGKGLELTFDLEMQLLSKLTKVQYCLELGLGVSSSQTAPATTAPNLETVNWNTVPALLQKFIVTQEKFKGQFGLKLLRSIADEYTANRRVFGGWEAAPEGSGPAATSFLIRARLTRFDTQNNAARVKGAIWAHLLNTKILIA